MSMGFLPHSAFEEELLFALACLWVGEVISFSSSRLVSIRFHTIAPYFSTIDVRDYILIECIFTMVEIFYYFTLCLVLLWNNAAVSFVCLHSKDKHRYFR